MEKLINGVSRKIIWEGGMPILFLLVRDLKVLNFLEW